MKDTVNVIARIRSDFPTKFGIPRQSGLTELESVIVFEPEYRNEDALRGIDGFSHLWLIWKFSKAERDTWSPTVRPPRLGGNKRLGVFATRSPFRPNPIGLSCVKLLRTEKTENGTVLIVSGADLMDGTPIYDIKPYLPYADCRTDATGGFTDSSRFARLEVDFPEELLKKISPGRRQGLISALAEDPRPHYQNDPERVYGFSFADKEIKFTVKDGTLTVTEVD